MMNLKFQEQELIKTSINLPASKSISNRLLILQALFDQPLKLENISSADDTVILQDCLQSNEVEVNAGMAGTAFRFLTAYFSIQQGDRLLTGDERMKQRPVGPLVDALRTLGAEIDYVEKEGFPPLRIKGNDLDGGKLEIQAGISSQFISALMLIAPKMKNGLRLTLLGDVVSAPYIRMTAEVLSVCGIEVKTQKNEIQLSCGIPQEKEIKIEADWSSAAFFYNFLCCTTDHTASIFFPLLKQQSIQGDAALGEIYSHLGIASKELEGGILISKNGSMSTKNEFNFRESPDLVQPFLVSCAVLNKEVKLKGISNLKIKETDRIYAMKTELEKMGAKLLVEDEDQIHLIPNKTIPKKIQISTYNDHRMAMSFAALSARIHDLKMENPNVVSKSFPGFWEEMRKLGVGRDQ